MTDFADAHGSPSPSNKPPFIADQHLARLIAAPDKAQAWISPRQGFSREWQTLQRDLKIVKGERCELTPGWYHLRSREELLPLDSLPRGVRQRRLICVVANAGRGKTKLLQWLQYGLASFRHVSPGSLPVMLQFDQVPKNWRQIDAVVFEHGIRPMFRGNADADAQARLAQRRGRLTLLVDALDQVSRSKDPTPEERAASLAAYVNHHPEVDLIVSGRPSAIEHFWPMLFQPGRIAAAAPWEFIQVADFTPEQAKQFLGKDKWEKAQRLGADVLSIPRALEYVQKLSPHELEHIRTKGELYWYALDRAFAESVQKQRIGRDRTRGQLTFLLSLLAFEGAAQGQLGRLEGDELLRCLDGIWKRRKKQIAENPALASLNTEKKFYAGLRAVLRLNHQLEPGVLEDQQSTDAVAEIIRLAWVNPTLQAYYAAFWLAREATPADRDTAAAPSFGNPLEKAADNVGDFDDPLPVAVSADVWRRLATRSDDDPKKRDQPRSAAHGNEFWAECFRFVAEFPGPRVADLFSLPGSPIVRSDDAYARAIERLFLAPNRRGAHTEYIYRAWPELLRLAGYPSASARDLDVYQATWKLGAEVHAAHGGPAPAGVNAAKHVLWEFLSEFPRLLATKNNVALSLMDDSRYIRCPPGNAAQVTFLMGSPKEEKGRSGDETQHAVTLSAFRLRDFVVTNAEYELFDASHAREKYTMTDGQPVVNVSWYDGVVYAYWMGLGFRLPTEAEWECGCRAGSETAYWWGPKFDETKAELDPWVKVKPAQGAFPPANDWGLSYMPGNVLQWCVDWYRADYEQDAPFNPSGPDYGVLRVLRGGSWDSHFEHYLRSAFRYRIIPGRRDNFTGLRLART